MVVVGGSRHLPQHLRGGDDLAHAGAILLDAVRRHLEPLVLTPFDLQTPHLREKAVVFAAVRMALDAAEEQHTTLL